MSDEEDLDLLREAGGGSNRAFGELVDRHQQRVRAFLRRLGHDHAEADDLAQETFLAAWTGARGFRGGSSVRSWLLGIAWRRSKGARRSWFRMRARDHAWQEERAMEGLIEAGREDSIAVRAALDALPLEQRAALALCLAGDFSHADAAQALGLPLGTVKSHVGRGREKLQSALRDKS